ncbi:hypothetical protein Tco_0763452 [Tanacetum coccineum]
MRWAVSTSQTTTPRQLPMMLGGPRPYLRTDTKDPVMQFVVHNFDRMNAMYKAFTQKLKDAPQQQDFANVEPPVIEPWNSDSDDLYRGNVKENAFIKKADRDVRDLVASSFTKRIRDYDMPDDIKVPTNLRTYDETTDPDDHLTVFIGTMDIHKLPEPVWCRFFQITLSGAARFWYGNLAPGSIDGFHQLRDNKETLHMADRSDAMISGAFISGLRPGLLFKDLIPRTPTSLKDLFTQTNNFIRAEDANNENRLRETRREMKQYIVYKDLPRRPRDKHIPRPAARQGENHRILRDSFTALVKSSAEILATSEGKTMLRPPPKMFTPGNKRDRTKYCEFHEDHGHDTNDCIDLRKEIEACVRKGRMVAKGAKVHNNSQNNQSSRSKDNSSTQIGWNDLIPEQCTGDNPLIITEDVGTTHIHRIYVDGGSSVEIMYEHCFEQLMPEEKKEIRPLTALLVGFAGQISWPLGLITLPVTV